MISYKIHKRSKNKIFRQRFKFSNVLYLRGARKSFKFLVKTLIKINPPYSLSEEIVGIHPMDGPTGQVFYLNYIP